MNVLIISTFVFTNFTSVCLYLVSYRYRILQIAKIIINYESVNCKMYLNRQGVRQPKKKLSLKINTLDYKHLLLVKNFFGSF